MTIQGSSEQVNRRAGNHPKIRVDTSEVERSIRRNKAVNDKLGPLGKLNMQWFNTKTPTRQYNFVPGHGWIETGAQGNRQIEEYRRRIEGSGGNRNSHTRSAPNRRSRTTSVASEFLTAIGEANFLEASQMVASDVLVQVAADGLLENPKSVASKNEEQLRIELRRYTTPEHVAGQLEQLVNGIQPGELGLARRVADGRTEVPFVYTDGSVKGTGYLMLQTPRNGRSSTQMITDVRLPSRHLTLLEYCQYDLIMDLPNLPKLAALTHPGRKQQGGDVRNLLDLDPTQGKTFEEGWQKLSEHARTWPLARFKQARFDLCHQLASSSTDAGQPVPQNDAIRADSLAWLQTMAETKRH